MVTSWAAARLLLALVASRPGSRSLPIIGCIGIAAVLVLYTAASVIAFGVLGGFLTVALLHLVGNVGMITSSITPYLTRAVVVGLIVLPLAYVGVVWASVRWAVRLPAAARRRESGSGCSSQAWSSGAASAFART